MTTIRQLADIAGVSSATVSMALRNHPRISPATRERIQRLAAKYHYRAPQSLLHINNELGGTIGCVVPEISRLYFARVLAGIMTTAFEADYHVVTLPGHWDVHEITRAVDMLVARGVNGLLIYPGKLRTPFPSELPISLLTQGIPIVFLSHIQLPYQVDCVTMNEEKSGQMVIEHLFLLGHRRIAHLGAFRDHPRQHAFVTAAEQYGMEAQFIENSPGVRFSERLANFYQQRPLPTAFVGFDDYYAAEAIFFLHQRGLAVPGDISVTGCSNCMLPTEPDLTTVEQHPEEMGRRATSLLLQRLQDRRISESYEPTVIKIEPQLVFGHSCTPPPRCLLPAQSRTNDQNSTYARLKRSAKFPWRMEDTEAALMQRFQQETAPDMRRRMQALLLLRSGYTRPMVARIVNVHLRTLCDWLAWYQAGGIDAVASHRRGGLPAVHRRLSEEQCQRLLLQYQQGRISTVQQACDWVSAMYHMSYTIGGMRKLLARLRSTATFGP